MKVEVDEDSEIDRGERRSRATLALIGTTFGRVWGAE
jgi:hypothetical protein